MTEKKPANNASKGDLVLHQTEDGRTRIECRFEGETVWLTQALMAELFDIGVGTVNHHLKEIYAEGELSPEATIRRHRIVRTEGQRAVAREIEHYDLDARRPRSSSRSLPAVARREGAGSHEPSRPCFADRAHGRALSASCSPGPGRRFGRDTGERGRPGGGRRRAPQAAIGRSEGFLGIWLKGPPPALVPFTGPPPRPMPARPAQPVSALSGNPRSRLAKTPARSRRVKLIGLVEPTPCGAIFESGKVA